MLHNSSLQYPFSSQLQKPITKTNTANTEEFLVLYCHKNRNFSTVCLDVKQCHIWTTLATVASDKAKTVRRRFRKKKFDNTFFIKDERNFTKFSKSLF